MTTGADLRGTTLGPYHLHEQIGQGGMGAVYRARQERVNRWVAVKVLPQRETPDTRSSSARRFEREAQILGGLAHPHILPLFDYGEDRGVLYLVMPLMAGGSLADRLRPGRPWDLPAALTLFEPLAQALDYAHTQQVLHRDLKPQNVLFDSEDRPYLSDFGIARMLTEDRDLTDAGVLIGTPAYMSPEQARGDRHLDGRSDIYALGIMLYQVVTGSLPFSAETPIGLSLKHISEPPRPPRELCPDIADVAQAALLTALAKDPVDRFPSAVRFLEALGSSSVGGSKPQTPTLVASAETTALGSSTLGQAPGLDWSLWVCGYCGASLRLTGPDRPCAVCGKNLPRDTRQKR